MATIGINDAFDHVLEQVQSWINKYTMKDILAGKKILCFGDSLMAGRDAVSGQKYDTTYGWDGGYPKVIKNRHPKATVYNYGKDGACISTQGYNLLTKYVEDTTLHTNILTHMNTVFDSISFEPDYIIMDGGGNDLACAAMYPDEVPVHKMIGNVTSPYEFAEPANTDTVMYAMETAFRNIYKRYPNCKILFIGIPCSNFGLVNTDNMIYPDFYNAHTLKSLSEKFAYICNKYGVTYVDVNNTALSGVGVTTESWEALNPFFYSDGAHLNAEGYEALGNIIDYSLITGHSNYQFDVNNFKVAQTDSDVTIYPNMINEWNDTSIVSYNITLSNSNSEIAAYEYKLKMTTGEVAAELNITPMPKFAGVTLEEGETVGMKPNCTYEISILDGLAVFREFEN